MFHLCFGGNRSEERIVVGVWREEVEKGDDLL